MSDVRNARKMNKKDALVYLGIRYPDANDICIIHENEMEYWFVLDNVYGLDILAFQKVTHAVDTGIKYEEEKWNKVD